MVTAMALLQYGQQILLGQTLFQRDFSYSCSLSDQGKQEIRVCTHKTCRRSGALQTLDLFKGLAPPDLLVESCGCLGRCGSGPNLVVLPEGLIISHCNTASHAARLLSLQCGVLDPDTNLKALALKQDGNKAFEQGDLLQGENLYSQAIDLKPSGGLHLIYANRSALRLAKGDANAALVDAKEATRLASQWTVGYLRQAEAYTALEKYDEALAEYSNAVSCDASLRRSPAFQRKLKQLETKISVTISS